MKRIYYPILLVGISVLFSCSEKSGSSLAVDTGKPVAYVNDTPITTGQVDYMATKFGLNPERLAKQPDAKVKIRQTLVNSRAMALLADSGMDKQARKELELAVAAYREELLVHRYLKAHVVPEPVGAELVEQYYRDHPDEFGGGTEKNFELLRAPDGLEEGERNTLIRKISEASKVKNWKALASQLGENVTYRKASARVEVLEEPLKSLVRTTVPGNVSALNASKGIMIVRVTSEKTLPPRALTEVSSDIRKRLAPMKLKEAVKKAAENAITQVTVRLPE